MTRLLVICTASVYLINCSERVKRSNLVALAGFEAHYLLLSEICSVRNRPVEMLQPLQPMVLLELQLLN